MSCAKNSKAVENEKELKKSFNNQETAEKLIKLNNGYSLEHDIEDKPDMLFSKLMMINDFSRKKALTAKAILMLTNNNKTVNFSTILTKLNKVHGIKTDNIEVSKLHDNVVSDITRYAKDIDKTVSSVEKQLIYSEHPVQTVKDINNYYGRKVVQRVKFTNQIVVNPTKEDVYSIIGKDIKDSLDKLTNDVSNHVKQQQEEGNYNDLKPFDDYDTQYSIGNSDIFDVEDTKENTNYVSYKDYTNALKEHLSTLQKRKSLLQVRIRMVKSRAEGKAINSIIVRLNSDIKAIKNTLNSKLSKVEQKATILKQLLVWQRKTNTIVDNIKFEENTDDIKELNNMLGIIGNTLDFIKNKWEDVYNDNENIKKIRNLTDGVENIQKKLDKKIIDLAIKTITSVSQERPEDIKDRVLKLLGSKLPDIDIISQWILNPLFSFNIHDEANIDNLSQAIVVYYMQNVFRADAFAKDTKEEIDSRIMDLRTKKKLDYTLFYQKDKDGNITPYLIHPFTQEFEKTKATILGELKHFFDDNNKKGNSNMLEEQIALSDAYTKMKEIGDFIDPFSIPEIKQEFENEFNKILPLNIFGFGKTSHFSTVEDAVRYKKSLIDKIGKHTYNFLVESQLKKIDTFLSTFKSVRDELFVNNQLNPEESNVRQLGDLEKEQLQSLVVEMSPFNYGVLEKDGFIPVNNNAVFFNVQNAELIPNKSSFYDQDFSGLRKDKDQYGFWKVLFNSTRYINDVSIITGNKNVTFNSLFDMSKSISEEIVDNRHSIIQRMGSTVKSTKDKLKTNVTTYNNELVKNTDTSVVNNKGIRAIRNTIQKNAAIQLSVVNEVFGKLIKLRPGNVDYNTTLQKLTNYVKEQTGVTVQFENTTLQEFKKQLINIINKHAEQQVMEQQSLDLGKVIKFYLGQASRIEASQNSLPVINLLKSLYSGIEGTNKHVRHRAVQRLDSWIDRVVRLDYNKNETTKGVGNIRTEELKRLKKNALDAYKATNNKDYLGKVQNEVRKFTVAKTINGIIQYTMFNTMVGNMLSGFGNRMYGIQQNRFIDATGRLWTTGNDDLASLFITDFKLLAIKNIVRRIATDEEKSHYLSRINEIEKANLLFSKLGVIQDMRNEAQKASSSIGKLSASDKLNPYYLSITRPELRNQGTTILNVLMDETILDNDGNPHKIFDGKKFIIYDNVNSEGIKVGEKYIDKYTGKTLISKGGNLVLKPEFRGIKSNIENWENFSGKQAIRFKIKATIANIVVQGDYSIFGGNMLKDTSVGKMLTLFMTYMPMIFHNSYGSGLNITTGKVHKRSIFGQVGEGGVAPIAFTTAAAHLGILPAAVVGMGGMTYEAIRAIQAGEFNKQLLLHTNDFLDSINLFKMIAEHMLNAPISPITRQVFRKATKSPINFKSIDTEHLIKDRGYDTETVHAMRALSHTMAIRAELLLATALAFAALYCDDKNKRCKQMTRIRNVLTNYLWMLSDNFALTTDPVAFVNQITQRAALMQMVAKMTKVGIDINNIIVKGVDSDVQLAGENRGQSKFILDTKKLLLPSIMRGTGLASNWRGASQIFKEREGDGSLVDQITDQLMSQQLRAKKHIIASRARYSAKLEKNFERGSKDFNRRLSKAVPSLRQREKNFISLYGINYFSSHKDEFYKEILKDKTWNTIKK